jgi:hypothetical protein
MGFEQVFGLLLTCLKVVEGDSCGHFEGLLLKVLLINLLAKLLEQSLEQLLFVIHDLDNRWNYFSVS